MYREEGIDMHSYLRAIGFSNLQNNEWKDIINQVIYDYDEKHVIERDDQTTFVEMSKYYGVDMGITVCGEIDENHRFVMEYAFPYFRGSKTTTTEDVYIECRSEKESYLGACEDMRLGVTLIFYLANAGAYLKQQYKQHLERTTTSVEISGLSLDGKIILPIKKDPIQVDAQRQKQKHREEMIDSIRSEEEASEFWEKITKEDFQEYTMLHRKMMESDILTIVDTYFIPYGMECDRYNVLGEITEVTKTINRATKEVIYQLSILCNDMEFDVCIHEDDLLGEPQVGRRFKGVIWAQGNLQFMESI